MHVACVLLCKVRTNPASGGALARTGDVCVCRSSAWDRRRFAGTALLRTKRRRLLRNVCVALGNLGDAAALPALQRAARDNEPLVAEHARWAIEQIDKRQSAATNRKND